MTLKPKMYRPFNYIKTKNNPNCRLDILQIHSHDNWSCKNVEKYSTHLQFTPINLPIWGPEGEREMNGVTCYKVIYFCPYGFFYYACKTVISISIAINPSPSRFFCALFLIRLTRLSKRNPTAISSLTKERYSTVHGKSFRNSRYRTLEL